MVQLSAVTFGCQNISQSPGEGCSWAERGELSAGLGEWRGRKSVQIKILFSSVHVCQSVCEGEGLLHRTTGQEDTGFGDSSVKLSKLPFFMAQKLKLPPTLGESGASKEAGLQGYCSSQHTEGEKHTYFWHCFRLSSRRPAKY